MSELPVTLSVFQLLQGAFNLLAADVKISEYLCMKTVTDSSGDVEARWVSLQPCFLKLCSQVFSGLYYTVWDRQEIRREEECHAAKRVRFEPRTFFPCGTVDALWDEPLEHPPQDPCLTCSNCPVVTKFKCLNVWEEKIKQNHLAGQNNVFFYFIEITCLIGDSINKWLIHKCSWSLLVIKYQ